MPIHLIISLPMWKTRSKYYIVQWCVDFYWSSLAKSLYLINRRGQPEYHFHRQILCDLPVLGSNNSHIYRIWWNPSSHLAREMVFHHLYVDGHHCVFWSGPWRDGFTIDKLGHPTSTLHPSPQSDKEKHGRSIMHLLSNLSSGSLWDYWI